MLPYQGYNVNVSAAIQLLDGQGFIDRRTGSFAIALLVTDGDVSNAAEASLLQVDTFYNNWYNICVLDYS